MQTSDLNSGLLSAEHRAILAARGISPEFAMEHGLRSVDLRLIKAEDERRGTKTFPGMQMPPTTGIMIPYDGPDDRVRQCRIRVDKTEFVLPGPVEGARHGEQTLSCPRYLCAAGQRVIPYITSAVAAVAGDVSVPIYIVEAPLKALSLLNAGMLAIGLGGVVAGAHDKTALTTLGEVVAHEDLRRLQWSGRTVYIMFDAGLGGDDGIGNPLVALGAARVWRALSDLGANVRLVRVPYWHSQDSDLDKGEVWERTDQGPDDYLARNGVEALKQLVAQSVPADPLLRFQQAIQGLAKSERAQAAGCLLRELYVQASLAAANGPTLAGIAALGSGVGKRDLSGIVREFHERLVARSATPVPDLTAYNLTDLGNAERLVGRHRQDIRYITTWKKWLVWDGIRWVVDGDGLLVRVKAHDTIRAIAAEAASSADLDAREAIEGWAKSSESTGHISAMLTEAASLPALHLEHGALDANPLEMNVRNGILDLRTGTLRPHERDAFCTKLAQVDYDPNADRSLFEKAFSKSLPDQDVRCYVLRLMGYSLTGLVEPHVLPVHYGRKGRNGKGTFLGALVQLMGDYADEAPVELITETGGSQHPTGLTLLFGKRFVLMSETGKTTGLKVATAKRLSGGDKVQARRMNEDFWSFLPTHKGHMATNHKPRIAADPDDPVWERLSLIGWEYIQEGDRTEGLKAKLATGEGAAGFFAAVVQACIEWQAGGLRPPLSVRAATNVYKTESDTLGGFISDRLMPYELGATPSKDIYKAYTEWCEANGFDRPMTAPKLTAELTERGLGEPGKKSGVAIRKGVILVDSADEADDEVDASADEANSALWAV